MPTLGQALDALESQRFAGRERELAAFQQWMDEPPNWPTILNVSGPGGIGKSALLGAFRRHAEAQGRRTLLVDGRTLAPTEASLLRALGGDHLDVVLRQLNPTTGKASGWSPAAAITVS